MVWKRFEGISTCWRHAGVSISASWLHCNLLDIADILGRFPAEPRIIGGTLRNRPVLRLSDIGGWLEELARVGLVHFYHPAPFAPAGGSRADDTIKAARFGVIHDFARHQPPGKLRYISAVHPPPPDPGAICGCILTEAMLPAGLGPSPSSPPPARSASPAPRLRRPSPSPSRGKEERMQGEKENPAAQKGVYGRDPSSRRPPPRPDCPKCHGSGYYQGESMIVSGVRLAPVTVSCECREAKTA